MCNDEVSEMVHVIGKDITKFHCIYWPAFLYAANLPFPKLVINHGHWLKNKVSAIIFYLKLMIFIDQNVKVIRECC